MIDVLCALCLVGLDLATARIEVDGVAAVALQGARVICAAAAAGAMVRVNGVPVWPALTVYAGTAVCAWHLAEEVARRPRCTS